MRRSLLVLTLLALMALPARAGFIAPGSDWTTFCFGGAGSPAAACGFATPEPTSGNAFFTIAGGTTTTIEITDAFLSGDRFRVVVNGGDIYFSSVPLPGLFESSADAAFLDGRFSRLSITLDPGFNDFEIFALDAPFLDGRAFVRVVSSPTLVPAPASLLVLALGLAGLMGARRARA